MLAWLLACSEPDASAERRARPTDDPGADDSGADDSGADDSGADDSGADDSAAPWVRLVSPADGATVANPVTFLAEGDRVASLALTADGWLLASWDPYADGWSVQYTFSGTGYPREIVLEGLDEAGTVVASDARTLTVEADGVDLDVPYFYQYDNRNEPGSTCGVTSTAMALNWWMPGHTTPDGLYAAYGKEQAQSPSGIAAIYRAEGLYAASTTSGTRAEIRAHLDAGRPVVAHGWWTSAGHIVAIVGYDDEAWIVNDPAGDWYACYGCGEADHVRYPLGGGWDDAMSVDGDLWFSVSDVTAF